MNVKKNAIFRDQLIEFLQGGFAPVVKLLREFHFDKAGIALNGLPFSAWALLEHMRHRQHVLLDFMKNPESDHTTWPAAYWPDIVVPKNEETWLKSIELFEKDLNEMIGLVADSRVDPFRTYGNGKSVSWAAIATFHHNAYTIGQIKAIGRQLGVW